ncbi:hypothetical protein S83_019830 [Arachis hypogaea]
MPAGCAPGRSGIAGERKVAGGDRAIRTGAYGVDEHVAREEEDETGPEEVQRGQEVNGYSNGDYHEIVIGGKASSGKPGLGIDLPTDRNMLVQNMEDRYGDRGNHKGEQRHANDDEDSSNEFVSLDEQMLENRNMGASKRIWTIVT